MCPFYSGKSYSAMFMASDHLCNLLHLSLEGADLCGPRDDLPNLFTNFVSEGPKILKSAWVTGAGIGCCWEVIPVGQLSHGNRLVCSAKP